MRLKEPLFGITYCMNLHFVVHIITILVNVFSYLSENYICKRIAQTPEAIETCFDRYVEEISPVDDYDFVYLMRTSFLAAHSVCAISGFTNFIMGDSTRFEVSRKIFELFSSFFYFFLICFSVFKVVLNGENSNQKIPKFNDWLAYENSVFFAWIFSTAIFLLCVYLSKFETAWRSSRHQS